MSYSDLYHRFSERTDYVKRSEFLEAVLSISGVEKIQHMRTGIDTSMCRGFFLKPTNTEHELVKKFGGHIILTARGMNRCWDRFIFCKELMHVFAQEGSCTDEGHKFDLLLQEFSAQPEILSEPFKNEVEAFWMASALICPRKKRDKFANLLKTEQISYYDIALQLKIPHIYVSGLFWPVFDDFLKRNDLT